MEESDGIHFVRMFRYLIPCSIFPNIYIPLVVNPRSLFEWSWAIYHFVHLPLHWIMIDLRTPCISVAVLEFYVELQLIAWGSINMRGPNFSLGLMKPSIVVHIA